MGHPYAISALSPSRARSGGTAGGWRGVHPRRLGRCGATGRHRNRATRTLSDSPIRRSRCRDPGLSRHRDGRRLPLVAAGRIPQSGGRPGQSPPDGRALWSSQSSGRDPATPFPSWLPGSSGAHGVTFFNETVVFRATPPQLGTSRGVIEAGAVVVCPGDDFTTLYPERIAEYGLGRCRLSMLKLADPGLILPGTLMSDLSLDALSRLCGYAPSARSGRSTSRRAAQPL